MNIELQRQLKKEARLRKKEYDNNNESIWWYAFYLLIITWVVMFAIGIIKDLTNLL